VKLEEVFGVSKDLIASYKDRARVDQAMASALRQTRQIIVYGSSKQGKTALVQRHIAETNRITVHCSPSTTTEDMYRSVLRQLNVDIISEKTTETSREIGASIATKFTAMIPFFGKGEAEAEGSATAGKSNGETKVPIEFNLRLAQDVGELLLKVRASEKFFVVENFHYLSQQAQSTFAFDLRTFEEMGLRFVILGVWREANRLIQFNGDLQDRIAEVPVEPWENTDFHDVLNKGQPFLNVFFSPNVRSEIFNAAHGSIAVVQELAKKLCEKAGVLETHPDDDPVVFDNVALVQEAIRDKVSEYAARHVRSLEAIAVGSRTRRATEDTAALYLPYYMVAVLVSRTYAELRDGIERRRLQELIRERHPTPDNVRTSDVTGMLTRLSSIQAHANIVPPLFDYDPGTRRVKIVDSTLYFFIDNCDAEEVMEEIPNPDPSNGGR
jgi:hypothetical protein